MNITLIENALDFILSALEHAKIGDDRNLKYAILHVSDGVELVLKEKLKREHWSLLFADINKANEAIFKSGAFKSVDFADCITRLETISLISLKAHTKLLNTLRGVRNKLQHFEYNGTKDEVLAILVGTWAFVLDFIHDHLSDVIVSQADQIEKIKELMVSNASFVKDRLVNIQSDIDTFKTQSDAVLQCPRCLQEALLIPGEDENPHCLFCRYTASANEAVDDWRYEFLGFKSPKEEFTNPDKHTCWECGNDTLIQQESGDMHPPVPAYVCFSCGSTFEYDEVDICDTCGNLYQMSDDDWGMCSDCVERQMEND